MVDEYQRQIDENALDMAKEHLAFQKAALAREEAAEATFVAGIGWNRQLIRDLKAKIKKTEATIDRLAARLGHR